MQLSFEFGKLKGVAAGVPFPAAVGVGPSPLTRSLAVTGATVRARYLVLFFCALLLAAFGGILMFAARTGPEEASSNLSKWISWMGMRPPEWLIDKSRDRWGQRIAVILFVVAAAPFSAWVYARAQNQNPYNAPALTVNQGPNSAYSYGQRGGITAGTINIGPGRLAFSSQLGEQLLERMPNRTKKVEMQVVGGKSDQAVGDDIYRYLLQSGYQQVDRGTPIGMLMDVQGAPDGPIYVMEDQNKYVLVVKPSAH
jgi:hypothetical protein